MPYASLWSHLLYVLEEKSHNCSAGSNPALNPSPGEIPDLPKRTSLSWSMERLNTETTAVPIQSAAVNSFICESSSWKHAHYANEKCGEIWGPKYSADITSQVACNSIVPRGFKASVGHWHRFLDTHCPTVARILRKKPCETVLLVYPFHRKARNFIAQDRTA